MFTMKNSWVAGFALATLAGATAPAAFACSVCRCGDPTFNALGTEVFQGGRFYLALDWDHLEKDQAVAAEEGGHHEEAAHPVASAGLEAIGARHEGHPHATSENLVERRLVLTAAWAPSERWQVIARLPYSDRRLAEGEERTSAAGLADPELLVRWRLWASHFEPGLGRANWISATLGVKTPWGQDDAADHGERLDQHAQAGTGSTDLVAGISGVHLLNARSTVYASLQGRFTGDNDAGYEYGDVRLANLGYEHKVGDRFSLALEANLRDADADVTGEDGDEDPNTGGAIAYLQPRFLAHLGKGLVGRLAAQIPVWDDLDGEQDEKTVLNLGLTFAF